MGPLLIKAGRVYDGVSDRALEHAYVVVDGNTITAVGPQAELAGSAERFAQVLDLGAGATVLPGLINMHTHMSFSSGDSIFDDHQRESYETKLIRAVTNVQAALRTGVTTVRDCGTLNGIAFAVRAAVESGTMLGPRVIASGEGITTTGGHLWFCGVEADSEVQVRRAVRAQVKAGADFIKVFATGGGSTPGTNALAAQFSEAEMCALTEEARRLDKRVASHAHGTPGCSRLSPRASPPSSTAHSSGRVGHSMSPNTGSALPRDLVLETKNAVITDSQMMPQQWLRTESGELLKLDCAAHGDNCQCRDHS